MYAYVIYISAIHEHFVSCILQYTVHIDILIIVISLDEGK
jgi:hypothetical protein